MRDEAAQLQIEEEGRRPCMVSPPVDPNPNGRPHASSGVCRVELRGAHRG
jgi:hypothetical protein